MYMDSIENEGYPARMVGIAHGTIWSGQQMEAFMNVPCKLPGKPLTVYAK